MKKGFTLIELLAVIVIIAIIALITTISVSLIITDSKDSLSEIQKNNLEDAAEAYYLKEGMSDNVTCVNVEYLIKEGYIDSKEVKDPKTNKNFGGSVKITYEANQYSYEYQTNSCE